MNQYKALIASMALTDANRLRVLREPRFEGVRALDAERVRLAEQYEAADGALLVKIRDVLMREGNGLWGRYRDSRILPTATFYERIAIAEKRPVTLARFTGEAAYAWTHCLNCEQLRYRCQCPDK